MEKLVGKVDSEITEDIFTSIEIKGDGEQKFNTRIQVATDTGVGKTILNRTDWFKIADECRLIKTKIKFRPWSTDQKLPVRGRAKVQLKAQAGAIITTYVYVNDDDRDASLLGKSDAMKLGIVKLNLKGDPQEVEVNRVKASRKEEDHTEDRERVEEEGDMKQIVKEFSDIFGGVGRYKGDPVRIHVDENAEPVIQPPRRIPIHYKQALEDHLDELLQEDVIEGPLKQEEPGTWISNLVITDKNWNKERKPGDRIQIRGNLDLRPLNKHVYQTHNPIPTIEELRHELKGSNKFSTLDMVHSFHQFELEEGARKLFTFRTPRGLMRFKRLVMGNNPASSEAQRRVKEVVEGLKGVLQIKDDVLVHGKGKEHDENLRKVLQRFREAGLTLRAEKCKMGRKEARWFGMIFSEEGMSADPDKVKLVKDWPAPKTVKDVESFLQTIQFNLAYMGAEEDGEMLYAELTAPLRSLTRQKVKFEWTPVHQKHFKEIKNRLCSDRVMVPYEVGRDTRIYTDGGTTPHYGGDLN